MLRDCKVGVISEVSLDLISSGKHPELYISDLGPTLNKELWLLGLAAMKQFFNYLINQINIWHMSVVIFVLFMVSPLDKWIKFGMYLTHIRSTDG